MSGPGRVRLGVLGPTTVAIGDRPLVLRSVHQRRIVAALALHRGASVPADRLIDIVWSGELPAHPAAALKNHLSRLRAAFGELDVVETVARGYRLREGAVDIDVAEFESAIEAARRVTDGRAQAAHLEEAVALWRGAPYEDLDSDAARAEGCRLAELRQAARETAGAARLRAGELTAAVAALEALCAEEPLREQARVALAEALARAGRRADALRTLDDLRRALVTELGLDPSTAVGRTVEAILDGAFDSPVDAGWPDRRTAAPPPLAPVTVFGREGDLLGADELLGASRLVTLVGPGGVGKTTLALVLAEKVGMSYRHGCAYVDLAGTLESADVPAAFARALGVERSSGAWTDRLGDALAGRDVLLVVDNVEQVIDAVAMLIAGLLRRAASIRLLVTSREPLAVPGERLWPVEPLPADMPGSAGCALFLDRAAAVRPDWSPAEGDLATVTAICARLDGLPLAIELAAAQMRGRSLDEIATRLDRPLDLPDRTRRPDVRYRGLRAMIDWSYALLDPVQQAVFDRLGVFAGGFLAETALRVSLDLVDGVDEFLGALVGLVERSLVRAEPCSSGTRYRLLDTFRRYAREQLERRGSLEETRDRHAAALRDLVEQANATLWSPDEALWAAILDDQRMNIIVAFRWLMARRDHASSLRLATAAYFYAWPRGRSEIRDLAEAAVEPVSDEATLDATVLALGLGVAADAALLRGDTATAESRLERGLLAARRGRPGAGAVCHAVAADLALFGGRTDEAAARYDEASAGFQAMAWSGLAAWTFACSALAGAYGHDVRAEARATDALGAAQATGSPSATAFARYALAEAVAGRDPGTARRHLETALADAEQVGASWVAGLARLSLATTAAAQGDVVRALEHYRVLIDLWRRAGTWTQQWTTVRTLAALLADVGHHAAAARLLAAIAANDGTQVWGEDAQRLKATEELIRRSLPAAAYEEARARGARLSPLETIVAAEEAVAAALT